MAKMQQMVEETPEVIEDKAELKVQKKRTSIPKELRDAFNTAIDKAVEKADKNTDRKMTASEKELKKEIREGDEDLRTEIIALKTDVNTQLSNANLKNSISSNGLRDLEGKVDRLAKWMDEAEKINGQKDGLIARLGAENAALATFAGVCTGVSLVIVAFLIAGRLM